MPPSAEEAARALREIATIRARAAGFQDYRAESSQLILWGFAYALGFVLTALFPAFILLVWLFVVASALTAGTVTACRINPEIPGIAWRYLTLVGAILLFCIILNIIMWPLSPEQSSMIGPLFVAALYVIRGVQLRPRYLALGGLLAIVSVAGFSSFIRSSGGGWQEVSAQV
ncbi:hypothetical protein SAMN05216421_1304 [Halopseudomonas xinjiangensis]|uniref:Uncharacterized protein n=1 Tax=Halopseudomonas xinjiangensis TaxID=487184 RepID=A0A1H1R7V4_9GAMM|nr:hypothetical protein [Halopseudomonas xinjiangensis]SDS31778.1 hypothetical protein SAMN05216421_1304 [Halopseudomonas xinjiangensis]